MGKNKDDAGVYLTTIDGNKGHGDFQTPNDLRTDIMFHLLFWDYVSVADSQFLTNPYFSSLLLDGQNAENNFKLKEFDSGQCFCDLDDLAQSGYLHCVSRDGVSLDMVQSGFVKRFKDKNRVLSKERTEGLMGIITQYDYFKLNHIADSFRNNLKTAFDMSGYLHVINSEISDKLKEEINKDSVYFDALEAMITEALKSNMLNQEEYRLLYNLIKSCYIPNVPNALGMNYLANQDFYPIWQKRSNRKDILCVQQRTDAVTALYCCVFDRQIVDMLPMEAYINILKKIRGEYSSENRRQLREMLLGNVKLKKPGNKVWALYNSYVNKVNQLAIEELYNVYGNRQLTTEVEHAASGTVSMMRFIPGEPSGEMPYGVLSLETELLRVDRECMRKAMANAFCSNPKMFLRNGGAGYISTMHCSPTIDINKYYNRIGSMLIKLNKNLIIES